MADLKNAPKPTLHLVVLLGYGVLVTIIAVTAPRGPRPTCSAPWRSRETLGHARARAEERWSKHAFLARFEAELRSLVPARAPQPLPAAV